MRVLNIISGSKVGGAEKFFERFCIALNNEKNVEQFVIIKKNNMRFELLNQHGLRTVELGFRSNFDFITQNKIKEVIDIFKPDVTLCWMNRASRMLPNSLNSKKFVGRLGGYYKLKNYAKCDFLIANTYGIMNYIIDQGWNPKKVICLPNFVSENRGIKLNRQDYNTPKNTNLLLGIGRFHENKGFDFLIRALAYNKDCVLWLVGEGKLKNFYLNLAREIGVSDRVRIINWTNQISKFYNTADILVCTSQVEPLGNIIIEGWSHKIPVIGPNIMGPDELIRNNINGLKYENNNLDDLVKCIEKLKNNKVLRNRIVNNAYDLFIEKYNERKVMKRFISFFNKIKS